MQFSIRPTLSIPSLLGYNQVLVGTVELSDLRNVMTKLESPESGDADAIYGSG